MTDRIKRADCRVETIPLSEAQFLVEHFHYAKGGACVGYIVGALMAGGGRADAEQAHPRVSDALAAPAAKRLCRILRGEE